MKFHTLLILSGLALCCLTAWSHAGAVTSPTAQDPQPSSMEGASRELEARLAETLQELGLVRERIASERLPLARRLRDLESELISVRSEFQSVTRQLEGRQLELSNLGTQIQARRTEVEYLVNLLREYLRNAEARLHVTESQRLRDAFAGWRLAQEDPSLDPAEFQAIQVDLLALTLERLHSVLGGARFEGRAVDAAGNLREGQFALLGPAALFRSADGEVVGLAEQRLGSLEPAVIAFADALDREAAGALVLFGSGEWPADATLGNAVKVESTQETLIEHVKKGGPVMIPIFLLAAAALLVALYKWLSISLIRKPSRKQIQSVLARVESGDPEALRAEVATLPGPTGAMLRAGVAQSEGPRDLVEEVMYEQVLTTRLSLQRLLPFVAIAAAAAPLLGLLGTVTGIINTFKLITVFGSGDVQSLSGGISEALITTKFGLIVAIPALLLHAFLSRRARGFLDGMESTAVAFMNHLSRARGAPSREVRTEDGAGRELQPAGPLPAGAAAAWSQHA